MLQYLSNAFNDPSNPWYYVIGVLFLLLIFGAVAVYIIFSGRKKNKKDETPEAEKSEQSENAVHEHDEIAESTTAPDGQEQDKE